jgi:hypothetical protein
VVALTQGNLTHDHVYLRGDLSFFPADAIGAPSARDGTGTMLTLHLEGFPGPIRTDIAADKKIFRCRGAWRDFFKRHHLQPGAQLVIERLRIRVPFALRPLTRGRMHARSAADEDGCRALPSRRINGRSSIMLQVASALPSGHYGQCASRGLGFR